jgi:hypothetical protein
MTEFLLGAAIITLIYQGVRISTMSGQISTLEAEQKAIYGDFYENDSTINRRIDQEINRTDNLHRETIQYVDSRLVKDKSKKKLLKG